MSFAATWPTIQAATDAVTAPTSPIPTTMSATAMKRPSVVTGKRSPYPTVVTVVAAHQSASAAEAYDPMGVRRLRRLRDAWRELRSG